MRKEFVDKNKVEKERRLIETNKKALKKNKKEVKAALNSHRLGWITVDREEQHSDGQSNVC